MTFAARNIPKGILSQLMNRVSGNQGDRDLAANPSIWKTVTVGAYKSIGSLADALVSAKISLDSGYAPELMRILKLQSVKEETTLVKLRLGELHLKQGVKLSDIYRQAARFGYFPVPPETAFHVVLNYPEQAIGESLFVGMEPLLLKGHKLLFVIFRSARDQRITVESSIRTFGPDEIFLFRV